MAVLEAPVQNEAAAAEVVGQRVEFANDARQFVRRQDADPLQAFGVHAAGGNVVEEELSIQDDVVAGQESLDPCVNGDAWFLTEQVGHGVVLLPESCRSGFSRELLMLPLPLRTQGRERDHSNGMPSVSGKPKARLRFCIACVAAPLSRLSSVATTTRRRPSSDSVKPPTSAPWRPAMRLTHGASSSTRSSGSSA